MKQFLPLLFLSVIFTNLISAQSKDEKAVAAAVETLRKAMVDGDRTALEKIADKGLTYGHSSGKIEDKATFVENIANGNSDFVTIDLTEQTIYLSGKTAIVRHKFTATSHDKGKDPGSVKLAILTVWQKDKKEWKLLARQAVKLQ
jgi:ketosteroid isomerase-like protein